MNNFQIKEHLIILERKLLNSVERKSVEEISPLFTDDYIEFGSSGKIYNKKDTIEALQEEPSLQISAYNFKVNLLVPETALVTYTAVKKDKTNNEIASLRSSVWKKTNERWQIVFHQGSKIQK